MTPQANMGRLRAFYDAFSRGDLQTVARYLHPEVEFFPAIVALDTLNRYGGRGECLGFLENLFDAWEGQWIEFHEVIEAPGDRLLVVERWHTRGRQGIVVDFDLTQVYEFRDDLIVRVVGFRDRSDALDAAGISDG